MSVQGYSSQDQARDGVDAFLTDLWELDRDAIHPVRREHLQELLRRRRKGILWGDRRHDPSRAHRQRSSSAVLLALWSVLRPVALYVVALVCFVAAGWDVSRPLGLVVAGVGVLYLEWRVSGGCREEHSR